jgi:LPS-assembly protein
LKPIRPNAPGPGEYRVSADSQEKVGPIYYLRGEASVETQTMLLKADEIDYNEETGEAQARGHVQFQHFVNGEKLQADHANYNTNTETGNFYDVSGSSPAKIDARPGVLATSNPFYFEGAWAERKEDRYILHNGWVTDCTLSKAWWILRGPIFTIVPDQYATSRRSIFWLKHIPIFYFPFFYKSLEKEPRKSGFLTPNIGNSSRRGYMLGLGYFWAINRSYDLTYRLQYFTIRGFAHNLEIRGKPNSRTDFGAILYGVDDRGIEIGNNLVKQGGFLADIGVRSDLGDGWLARGDFQYLSSFTFRANFTESFNEAIYAESPSTGYITKHWSSFGQNFLFNRDEVFLSTVTNSDTDKIITRKLPEYEFLSREREISDRILPIWISFDSSAGFLNKQTPTYSTSPFVDRLNVAPQLTTAVYWKGFSLVPSFAVHDTEYGESMVDGNVTSTALVQAARVFTLDVVMPSLYHIYKAPKWLHTDKLKHVIEPRVTYRDISGVNNFNQTILFDETDIWADTNEVELSLTNRLYTKDKNGNVNELLTWEVAQRRYFDPTFGGAVIDGQRNVFISSADLTGFGFIDQPRNYSPVVSWLHYNYIVGIDWQISYDPLQKQVVNNSFSIDYRRDKYFISVGQTQVHTDPVLAPGSNQIHGSIGIGKENQRGWNAGFQLFYDYRQDAIQFATTQITYNTNCCGFSVQWQRFGLATRNENQFRIAFAIANIGTFGTLKRQARMF